MIDHQKIYDQFDAATKEIGAYAIFAGDKYAARIVLKYPRDGAGRLYCYVHIFGSAMVRGSASGGGYDKATAAFEDAIGKLVDTSWPDSFAVEHLQAIMSATGPDGSRWARRLEKLGYTVACVSE
jgi:hypothetical protein